MGAENIKTIKGKLLTYKEDIGGYIVYVFENLDYKLNSERYLMCTRFPNWDSPQLNIGDIGFVKYKLVEGGSDTWYDFYTRQNVPYKYTGIHFLDFIREKGDTKEIKV